jgi:acetoacetyl-CoA synthetase
VTAEVLWSPSPESVEAAAITAFGRALGYDRYDELWRWSVVHPGEFWAQVWRWQR